MHNINKLKHIIWFIAGIIVTGTLIVSAAPTFRLERSIHPETDSSYGLGTSSLRWQFFYTDNASTTNLQIDGITGSTQCLQVDTNGVVTGTGLTCGSGGGGGSDTNWSFFNGSGIRLATTSNQVLIGATRVQFQ